MDKQQGSCTGNRTMDKMDLIKEHIKSLRTAGMYTFKKATFIRFDGYAFAVEDFPIKIKIS